MRYAVIDSNNKVVNIIITTQEFVPPRNHTVIATDTAKVGDAYNPATRTFS